MSDEYQSIPVGLARAAVQESGELVALKGPLYLATGTSPDEVPVEVWAPYFLPTEGHPHPLLAKVVVTRKGQEPREVVISWDEYAAELELENPEWLEKRKQKPMAIFGAEVERHGYRVVFADVLAEKFPPRIIEDRRYGQADPVSVTVVQPWENRDWIGEASESDAHALNRLYDEARDAGALVAVDGLQQAFTDRLIELSAAPKLTPAQPKPQQGNRRRRGKRPENARG